MKKFFKNKYFFSFITLTCAGTAILMVYYVLFKGSDFSDKLRALIRVVSPIIYGFVMAYILTPLLNFIENKIILPMLHKTKLQIDSPKNKKKARYVSVFFTMLIFILLIFLFFRMLVPQVIDSVEALSKSFPDYVSNTSIWLNQILKDYPDIEAIFDTYFMDYSEEFQNFLTGDLVPALQSVLKSVSSNVLSTVVGLIRVIWNLLIGLIVSIYMLSSKELFAAQSKRLLYSLFKDEFANNILKEVRFIHRTFIGFFAGKIVDSAIIGILCFVVTSIMGTPYALLVSVVVGVTNIIPFIGPLIGAVPSALLIFVIDPKACLYFVIFILILQQLDGNFIGPKILGESTGLSTFWVIFAITVFGGIYGILGILIGVPAFAVIYSAIKEISKNRLLAKGLPEYTTAYTYLDKIEEGKIILHNEDSEKKEGVVITLKLDSDNKNIDE